MGREKYKTCQIKQRGRTLSNKSIAFSKFVVNIKATKVREWK